MSQEVNWTTGHIDWTHELKTNFHTNSKHLHQKTEKNDIIMIITGARDAAKKDIAKLSSQLKNKRSACEKEEKAVEEGEAIVKKLEVEVEGLRKELGKRENYY